MTYRSNILLFNGNFIRGVYALAGVGFLLATAGCSSQKYTRMAKQQTVTVKPNPLEIHGGTATADVVVTVPPGIIKGKYNYAVEFIYQPNSADGKTTQLLRIPFQPGHYLRYKKKLTAAQTVNLPWQPGQESGVIKARGVLNEKREFIHMPYKTVAEGFITTYQLAVPEEPHGFITSPYTRKEEQNQYVFYFNNNSSTMKSYVGADSGPLADFIALNNKSKHVKITAYQTPDEKAATAKKRAESVKNYYVQQIDRNTYRGESSKVKFDIITVSAEAQPIIEEVKKSPMPAENKAEVLKILQGSGSFQNKIARLRKLKNYKYLQDYIYPSLRRVNMEAIYERPEKMNFEIALTAERIAKGEIDVDMLSADEFAYAAELTPLMKEKERILKAASRIHKRPQDAYNLGVFYMMKARKEPRDEFKKEYYEAAIQKFREATGTFNTPKVYYNLASAYQMAGNTDLANQYYDVTTRLQGGEEFTQKVISARAAMLVKDGKYKEAARVLENAGEGYSANISRGLISIYNQQYTEAAAAFTQAATAEPDNGLPHYLLAITGARSGNNELVYSGLKAAVAKDRNYIEKALDDLEFRNYKGKSGFRDALK